MGHRGSLGCLRVAIAGHGGTVGAMGHTDTVGCWVWGLLVGLGTAVGDMGMGALRWGDGRGWAEVTQPIGGAVGCRGALWDTVGRCRALWGTGRCCGALWGGVGHCGAVWGAVGRCGALWGAVGHWEALWGTVGRCGALRGAVGCRGALWGNVGHCGVSWGTGR